MQVIKSGAYLWYDGSFVFEIGPKPGGEFTGVVRLGGHMEPGETPVYCALREIREEAQVEARLIDPPAAYRSMVTEQGEPGPLEPGTDDVLLITYHGDRCTHIYLCVTDEAPTPDDAKGLLFLPPHLLEVLAQGERSLPALLAQGARYLPRIAADPALPLVIGHQVLLLAEILRLHPDLPAMLQRLNC